jgi:ribose/xylose/arabinose/galactoside ABC-type transport system permease subunit
MTVETRATPKSLAAWQQRRLDRRQAARLVREFSMLAVLLLFVAFFSVTSNRFLSVANMLKILNDTAVVGILALGMTFILIIAGVDLSVGSIVTMTTVVIGTFLVTLPVALPLALVLGLLTGPLIGIANGLIIARLGVPPIITTLGVLSIVQSLASYTTQGAITSLSDFEPVTFLGAGHVGAIPVPVVILLGLTAICHILLTRTSFGARLRGIGTNRRATALMGINVAGYTMAAYALSGLLASVAGLIVAGRIAAASSQAGVGLELPAIASVILGGTSLFGGSGSILGTLVGALILSVLFSGLILLGLPFFYQLVATGVVLILAIGFNETLRRVT